jgi:1,4-alpha-glucan branching enzyme
VTATPLSAAEIAAIVAGDHRDPFGVLGPQNQDSATVIRTFQPGARAVEVVDPGDGRPLAALAMIHPEGLFEGDVPDRRGRFAYRLRIRWEAATTESDDPYRFAPLLGELDVHLLAEGTHLRAFERLGAHPRAIDDVPGVAFAVWAPNARRVSVVGPFNAWDGRRHPMRLRHECGVWEIFVPGLAAGELYKYEIKAVSNEILPLKADPYARRQERPPETASVVAEPTRHDWTDGTWMASRASAQRRDAPVAIYEVHFGSWRRKPEGGGRYFTYAEAAEALPA